MAKSNLIEKHSLSVTGVLDIEEDGRLFIEIDELGKKSIADLLVKFNGELVSIGINKKNEISE